MSRSPSERSRSAARAGEAGACAVGVGAGVSWERGQGLWARGHARQGRHLAGRGSRRTLPFALPKKARPREVLL